MNTQRIEINAATVAKVISSKLIDYNPRNTGQYGQLWNEELFELVKATSTLRCIRYRTLALQQRRGCYYGFYSFYKY